MTEEGKGKIDLSGVTLYDVEKKSLLEICREAKEKIETVRARKDPALEKTRGTFRSLPGLFVSPLLKFISFLSYTLNLDMRWAGLPKDPFGSLMITNVGSLGLDVGYVPLVPYSRVPILLAMGAVKQAPIVENGEVIVANMMNINATFDHRIIDGAHAAIMSKAIRGCLENPFEHLDPLD
jgi:pyruvate dehydrogenase E2 component (dihydrolipoamide acetyltransferase)